ncbi:MAG: FAD synthetase family protein [Lachnospiraceae bacterium]|nr:FAD synthetase family protein [Lachnospiraceae bacterium]
MRIIRELSEFHEGKSAVAIGKFDGVHRGHRKLIGELVRASRECGLVSVILTFDPPPAVLFGAADAEELIPAGKQQEIFAQLGVDVLVEYPFTRETAATPPDVFVNDVLLRDLHASLIVCGSDVSFGDGGRGDLQLLQSLTAPHACGVLVVDKVLADGTPISSTRIRQAIREGHEAEARALLE